MAPPKKPNGPMVRRMIQLDTVDIENVTELRKRLGEQSDAATFRRAVRMALDATSGRVVAPGPVKPAQRVPQAVLVNKPAGVGVEVQLGPTRAAPGSRLEKGRKKR